MSFTNMYRMDGWVKAVNGYAVPGAQIWICLQPSNTGKVPPSPLANVFSDVNGLVPISLPIITDGWGHYNFYAAAGVYTVIVALGGIISQVYPDQSLGGYSGTTGGGTNLVISGTPQIGDILRYNVNGDGNWDLVNAASLQRSVIVYPSDSSTFNYNGYIIGGGNYLGSGAQALPTATTGWGRTLSAGASGSTITVVGFTYGQNGNNSLLPVLAWYRWTTKLALGNLANVRYWVGLGCWNSTSSIGNNGGITGTAAYANDLPNKTTIGFRYSAGTDATWKAVSIQASGGSTVVDTGVTPDTGIHKFEVSTDAAGTALFYFIDGVLVATITTNLPIVNTVIYEDALVDVFAVGDNKNTAMAMSLSWYGSWMSLK